MNDGLDFDVSHIFRRIAFSGTSFISNLVSHDIDMSIDQMFGSLNVGIPAFSVIQKDN